MKAVVDGQGEQRPALASAPGGGEAQEGDRVSAAGEGQGERPRVCGVEPPFERGLRTGGDGAHACGYSQRARLRTAAALARTGAAARAA